jgi:hypothetical protein
MHADREGDELLGPDVESALGECRPVQLPETLVDLWYGPPQLPVQRREVAQHRLAVDGGLVGRCRGQKPGPLSLRFAIPPGGYATQP